ncbi:efflux RND transporter periplasmic adaptor subunit [Palleronia sp. KMU-117]|uniref:efflux RND transporter periplasmic adaptor subunit n=1 Tax=Palleronia sp. KMU-117 TaxID=3434108 RepID=UPI003D73DB85
MKPTLRTVVLTLLALIIAGGLLYVTFRTQPVPVDLTEVAAGPMRVTINADGKTRIREVYDVASPIAGTALRAPVDVGDPVTKGETVVAIVEPAVSALLDARSRIEAEAAVREAEAGLDVAQSQVRQAREDLDYARQQYARTQALVERGVASVTRLEDADAQVASREAALSAAQSRVDLAQSTLERAKAALFEPGIGQPGNAAGDCCIRLTAPVDGVVLSVEVVSERPVSPGTTLVTVGDPTDLEIVADLLSSDAIRVGPGTGAIVERWGGPNALRAELRSIDPIARTRVSALGIEEQRVDARLDFLTPPEERTGLGHGFSVFLRLIEWEEDDVLQAPLSALFRQGADWYVFVADQGVARLTKVEAGRRNEASVQILSGLQAGQRVVTHPSDQITDGAEIVER